MEGHIKLHRTILESQVFAHPTSLKIWIWCLVKASYKERFVPLKIGRGVTSVRIMSGQFIFGRNKAQDELGIDGSTIYKWMQKFASEAFENMISLESNNQYTIVTLSNWGRYQSRDEQEVTTEEQPSNSQVTAEEQRSNTNKKDKKDKKDKNKLESAPTIFSDPVPEVVKKDHPTKQEREIAFRKNIFDNYRHKYPEVMLQRFADYWTESSPEDRKMRYEKQEAFDISRRLATWDSRERTPITPTTNGNKRREVSPVPGGIKGISTL